MFDVILDPSCFVGLVTSAIEVYPWETGGLLIGEVKLRKIQGKRRRVVVLEVAYPVQSAERTWTEVDIENNRQAYLRAIDTIIALLDFNLVGEYHSHTRGSLAELSEDDRKIIKERIEKANQSGFGLIQGRWLEIILRIDRRDYKSEQEVGWNHLDYERKVRCIIRTKPKTGYDITIGGFWLESVDGCLIKHEAIVYVP